MEKRKLQSKKRYVTAFIIGTCIFILGFLITYSISYFEFNRVSDLQDLTTYEIFKDKLLYEFFNEDLCSNDKLQELSDDLGAQGAIISDLEDNLGKNNEKVIFRKKFYTLIELEHLDFINKINKNCNKNISIILFFYSNEEDEFEESEDAGKLLDYIHRTNDEVVIYSFDKNLDSELIENLNKRYKISKTPTIIVNNIKVKNIELDNIIKLLKTTDIQAIFL